MGEGIGSSLFLMVELLLLLIQGEVLRLVAANKLNCLVCSGNTLYIWGIYDLISHLLTEFCSASEKLRKWGC